MAQPMPQTFMSCLPDKVEKNMMLAPPRCYDNKGVPLEIAIPVPLYSADIMLSASSRHANPCTSSNSISNVYVEEDLPPQFLSQTFLKCHTDISSKRPDEEVSGTALMLEACDILLRHQDIQNFLQDDLPDDLSGIFA